MTEFDLSQSHPTPYHAWGRRHLFAILWCFYWERIDEQQMVWAHMLVIFMRHVRVVPRLESNETFDLLCRKAPENLVRHGAY